MATSFELAVTRKSLTDFLAACERVGPDADEVFTKTLGEVAAIVQTGAAGRTFPVHAPSAVGYKAFVAHDGARVVQSRSKTTGERPDWGSWMMRHALIPALYDNTERLAGLFWNGADEVCRRFEA